MLLFQILSDGILLKPLNMTNLILQNSYILVLAIGMVLVIITGHIDLSVGSVAAFVGAVSAIMMVEHGMSRSPLAMMLSLAVRRDRSALGRASGSPMCGFPPSSSRWRGCYCSAGLRCWCWTASPSLRSRDGFRSISTGFIPDFPGGWDMHLLTLSDRHRAVRAVVFMEWRRRQVQTDTSSSCCRSVLPHQAGGPGGDHATCLPTCWPATKVFRTFSSCCLS